MPTQLSDKDNLDALEFSTDQWAMVSEGGTRTYTATQDGATVTVKFRPPRGDQPHTNMKTGSTVTRHADGSVTVSHKT